MKKLLIFTFVFFLSRHASAQITLEHVYDSASAYNITSLLYMVTLEVDSYKYVRIFQNGSNRQLRLYNLDHSIWKTVDLSNFPYGAAYNYTFSILYISQHLFNTDDSLEFMYAGSNSGSIPYTGIYSESGTLIWGADSLFPYIKPNVPQAMRPIYNTNQGTKMILSQIDSKVAKVYSLRGKLTNSIDMTRDPSQSNLNLSPTPSNDFTNVDFALPQGVHEAKLTVFDLAGNKLREYAVDGSFNNIAINNRDLPAGTYFFSLQNQNEVITRKQVVIH